VTSLLPLSSSFSLVFDRERNIFLFERVTKLVNKKEELGLDIVACIRSSDVITHAIEGDLNIRINSEVHKDESS